MCNPPLFKMRMQLDGSDRLCAGFRRVCVGPKVKTTIDNVDLTNMPCHVQHTHTRTQINAHRRVEYNATTPNDQHKKKTLLCLTKICEHTARSHSARAPFQGFFVRFAPKTTVVCVCVCRVKNHPHNIACERESGPRVERPTRDRRRVTQYALQVCALRRRMVVVGGGREVRCANTLQTIT